VTDALNMEIQDTDEITILRLIKILLFEDEFDLIVLGTTFVFLNTIMRTQFYKILGIF
jgi:hypothetical protein